VTFLFCGTAVALWFAYGCVLAVNYKGWGFFFLCLACAELALGVCCKKRVEPAIAKLNAGLVGVAISSISPDHTEGPIRDPNAGALVAVCLPGFTFTALPDSTDAFWQQSGDPATERVIHFHTVSRAKHDSACTEHRHPGSCLHVRQCCQLERLCRRCHDGGSLRRHGCW
jgi:hypothetical protein